MSEQKQVWVIDDALLSSLFGEDSPAPEAKKRPAPAGLSRAISMHLEGKSAQALEELARSPGGSSSEILSAKGQIEFELERYEDAARSYAKIAEYDVKHKTAHFNLGVCREK